MIFHTIHTMSLRQFSLLNKTKDLSYIKRLSLPCTNKQKVRANEKLLLEYNELMAGDEVQRNINTQFDKVRMWAKISKYDSILKSFLPYVSNGLAIPAEIIELYKKEFGSYNETEDLVKLANKISFLSAKYKETYTEEPKQEQDFDFDKYILNLEMILEIHIDKANTYLYELKSLSDEATRITNLKRAQNGRN